MGHDLVSKDLQAFRVELDREFRSRFEQFDRRFDEAQHKFKNLSRALLGRHALESEISQIMHTCTGEPVECQLEKDRKQANVPVFEEHTECVFTRDTLCSQDLLKTFDHDSIIEQTDCAHDEKRRYSSRSHEICADIGGNRIR